MIVSMTRSGPAAAVPDAEQRLGQDLLGIVRRQDAAISAHQRTPRTVVEMRARVAAVALYEEEQDACGLCGDWICTCPESAAIADRRRPRTTLEMRVRQVGASSQQACGDCHGSGGRTVDTSEGGVTRQHWQTCDTCHGTGVV